MRRSPLIANAKPSALEDRHLDRMTHIEEHSRRDSTKWFARGKALLVGISDFPASRTTAAATFVTLWAGAGRSDSGRVWSLERLPALCYRSSA